MGLDTSHNAWHGPYSSFGNWRKQLSKMIGIENLDQMEGFGGTVSWDSIPHDDLHALINHSDCDGHIPPGKCGLIAKRLRELLSEFKGEINKPDNIYFVEKTEQFAKGCELAHSRKEKLEFH